MRSIFDIPQLDKKKDKLSFKVITWILRRDFQLPPLNRIKKTSRNSLTSLEVQEIQKAIPAFKYGRNFSDAEDAVILRRLQVGSRGKCSIWYNTL